MTDPADKWLVEGLRRGEEQAFASIYDRFAERMFRVALALGASRTDAEDAVHDTFLALWRARKNARDIDNLRAYLFASLRRAVGKRAVRRRKETQWLATRHPRQTETLGKNADDDTLSGELTRQVGLLPVEQREVLALKIYAGLTFAETAATLGISINTAASRYRYALEKLRTKLTRQVDRD